MDVMEDIDKKRLCQMLIEKVEIYDDKNKAGRWVKAIHFKLPIIEEDLEISLDNSTPVEGIKDKPNDSPFCYRQDYTYPSSLSIGPSGLS